MIYQGAPFDTRRSTVDRNFRVLKRAVSALVANAQLQHLTGTAGNRILMALATGLRVEERTKAVRDGFEFLKLRLVCLVRRVVCDAVTLIVKAGGRLSGWRTSPTRCDTEAEATSSNPDQGLHGSLRG